MDDPKPTAGTNLPAVASTVLHAIAIVVFVPVLNSYCSERDTHTSSPFLYGDQANAVRKRGIKVRDSVQRDY